MQQHPNDVPAESATSLEHEDSLQSPSTLEPGEDQKAMARNGIRWLRFFVLIVGAIFFASSSYAVDDHGDDAANATTISAGVVIDGSFEADSADTDYFSFSVAQKGLLRIDIEAVAPNASQATFSLLDVDGHPLRTTGLYPFVLEDFGVAYNGTDSVSIDSIMVEPGSYYLALHRTRPGRARSVSSITAVPVGFDYSFKLGFTPGGWAQLDVVLNGGGRVFGFPQPDAEGEGDCTPQCDSYFGGRYLDGTEVTIVYADPNGAVFEEWVGCDAIGYAAYAATQCLVTMNADKSVEAVVSMPSYSLDVDILGPGTVSSDIVGIDCGTDCSASFVAGTAVTLTAVADPDFAWGFDSWDEDSGCADRYSPVCTVSMDKAKQIGATFTWPYSADIDEDGIPNIVEEDAGLDPEDAADAQGDLDGDGWRNLDEYRLGTRLNDADETPLDQAHPHQRVFAGDGSGGDEFGSSVAISGDTAVIGALLRGAAYVFTKSEGIWLQQSILTPSEATSGFGGHVAIDGDRIVVGAELSIYDGAVFVFARNGSGWVEEAKLTPFEYFGSCDGGSLAISGDTILVGNVRDDELGSSAGAVNVYTRSGSIWSQQAKLFPSERPSSSLFGCSVALKGDVALVGAPRVDGFPGSAYAFTRSGNTWVEAQRLAPIDSANTDRFGGSVALDGATALIGAYSPSVYRPGAAYIFEYGNGEWTETAKLQPGESHNGDKFGIKVAIRNDLAIVGADYSPSLGHAGTAYLFRRSGTAWASLATLSSNGSEQYGARFGSLFLALSDDSVLIGARDHGPEVLISPPNIYDVVETGQAYFFSYGSLDVDGDGLTGDQEASLGTDPIIADSDSDGLTDGEEVLGDGDPAYAPGIDTDPLNPDTDGDGDRDGDDRRPLQAISVNDLLLVILHLLDD